jgi:hypothetical protein
MRVTDEQAGILDRMRDLDGGGVQLADDLERDQYLRVDKLLKAIGLKWNRSKKGHFPTGDASARDAIDMALLTGQVTDKRKELQQFDTPKELADRIAKLACSRLRGTILALEPSAGSGRIADALSVRGAAVECVEIDTERAMQLHEKYPTANMDFLEVTPEPKFDVVAMNPPFTRQQDAKHIMHAWKFLAPGGELVAVAGAKFRDNKIGREFTRFLDDIGATVEDLDDGTFKESGTQVCTVLITADKR